MRHEKFQIYTVKKNTIIWHYKIHSDHFLTRMYNQPRHTTMGNMTTMGNVDTSDLMMKIRRITNISSGSPKVERVSWTQTACITKKTKKVISQITC